MATPETLEALELPGHRPSAPGTGADHPMRTMTRRAAGLLDPPWDREAASEVAALFDSLAPEWHTRESADRTAIVRDALDRGLDPLVRPRSAGPGGTPPVAVELGAGLGTYSGEIAARFSLCLAVELSAEMHRLAHPSGAHRILADGSRLPVPDGSVDAVVLVNCFLFPQEVQRVLRVGGVVLWVNSSGTSTPIHLSTDEVVAALPFATSGVESRAGVGTWCALRREEP
ncbi:MAG: class I SAM-dependent methyltransferase [Microthrixaceae bacterium]